MSTMRHRRAAPHRYWVMPPHNQVPVVAIVTSTGAHALLVLLLAIGASFGVRSDLATSYVTTALRYLLPALPEPGAGEELIHFGAMASGTSSKPAGLLPAPASATPAHESGSSVQEAQHSSTPSIEQAAAAQNAFTFQEVDSMAVRDPSSAGPEYPGELQRLGIAGFASMRFVVDSTGRIDLNTVELLEATHLAFAEAVRDAMPRMRFRPAMMGTRPVRQISEQRFRFQIDVATPSAPSTKRRS